MSEPAKKIDGLRRFMVFTKPHIGDPAWLTPVVELDDSTDPATPVEYQDFRVLEQVVLDLGRSRDRAAGYNAGAKEVLAVFGLSAAEYVEKKKAKLAAKKATNGETDKPI
jgi:hypothetical protein